MTFSAAAATEMAKFAPVVWHDIEAKTNFAESSAWAFIPFMDFTRTQSPDRPSTLAIVPINKNFQFSLERSKTNRMQLFADVRLTAHIGSESEVKFLGRVRAPVLTDFGMGVLCEDRSAWVEETEYNGTTDPTEVEVVAVGAYRQIFESADFADIFFLQTTGAGDEGFDEATSTRRRSWAGGTARIFYDAPTATPAVVKGEVPGAHLAWDFAGGAVQILEDHTGKTYFIENLRSVKESAATGAANVDVSVVVQSALEYGAIDGGPGIDPADIDIPTLGRDLSGPLTFPASGRMAGRIGDLIRSLRQAYQQNWHYWYDSPSGKHCFKEVVQKAPTFEDWTVYRARSIAHQRDLSALFSRLVATGYKERPQNALAEAGAVITDISPGGSSPFLWNKTNGGSAGAFADMVKYLYNGDGNAGFGLDGLPASYGTGTTMYDSWYPYIQYDRGKLDRLSRVRAIMPPSANQFQGSNNRTTTGGFWPGIWVRGSRDGVDWFTVAYGLDRIFARPGDTINVSGEQITRPYLRYVQIFLPAFKQGFDNLTNPAAGLMELELLFAEEYRHVFEVQALDMAGAYDWFQPGLTAVSNYYPDFCTRLGFDANGDIRHRTQFKDWGNQYPEMVAYDASLQLWAEGIRNFTGHTVSTTGPDPRFDLYDTISAPDDINGDASFLLDGQLVHTNTSTTLSGNDYRAEALSNS